MQCFAKLMRDDDFINEIKVNGETIVPFVPSDKHPGHRSGFETTFNSLCNRTGMSVIHEPLKFFLSDKSAYVPDFLLWPSGHGPGKHGPLVEVKGRWLGDGKKKFRLFTKDYPDLKIFLVDEKMLRILTKGHPEQK
jgi:hypothetical protein